MGSPGLPLGLSWAPLGLSWALLGPSWALWDDLGDLGERPGGVLGGFWCPFWLFVGAFGCKVGYVRIASPLERESNSRGSGGSVGAIIQ